MELRDKKTQFNINLQFVVTNPYIVLDFRTNRAIFIGHFVEKSPNNWEPKTLVQLGLQRPHDGMKRKSFPLKIIHD